MCREQPVDIGQRCLGGRSLVAGTHKTRDHSMYSICRSPINYATFSWRDHSSLRMMWTKEWMQRVKTII